MDRDVSAACQMFLIPSTIMFAALANAGTEGLKVFIGLMGVATSFIWLLRIRLWTEAVRADRNTATSLSALFLVAWLGVTAVHAYFGFTSGFMR